MVLPARTTLLLLLTVAFSRLVAAEPAEITSLRAKAEKGNAIAQYNLGLAYTDGQLLPVDIPEAFAWLSLASENGSTGKELNTVLGNMTDAQLATGRERLENYRAMIAAKSKAAPAPRTHVVAPGDTLGKISRLYYGTANRWPEILAANSDVLRDERSLVVGRILKIP